MRLLLRFVVIRISAFLAYSSSGGDIPPSNWTLQVLNGFGHRDGSVATLELKGRAGAITELNQTLNPNISTINRWSRPTLGVGALAEVVLQLWNRTGGECDK